MVTGNSDAVQDLLLRIIQNKPSDVVVISENQDFELKRSALNRPMKNEMLKTVTGFLNSYTGGILFIGVEDDNRVAGLEKSEENFKNTDLYEQAILDILRSNLHDALNRISENIRFHHFVIDGRTVCALEVKPFFPTANEPLAFCEFQDTSTGNTTRTFFKRRSNTTVTMTAYEVAMDMLNRRRGELVNPTAPDTDAIEEGKPYKLFDEVFTLLRVNPNVKAANGKMRTELIFQKDGQIYKKYRNEDWKKTSQFIADAKLLVGRNVKLTAWKDKENGDDFWWNKGFIANIYPVNVTPSFRQNSEN